jgi:hypothetical protein
VRDEDQKALAPIQAETRIAFRLANGEKLNGK